MCNGTVGAAAVRVPQSPPMDVDAGSTGRMNAGAAGPVSCCTMQTVTDPKPADRRRSRLALEADAAARALLLATLERCDWQLSEVAAALDLSNVSGVLRAIRHLGLVEEYEAARAAGKIRPGRRPK